MPVDLTAIRALLASVAGFTPGPWKHANKKTAHVVSSECVVHRIESEDWAAMPGSRPRWIADAALIAAAPDLHRELTEAVGEIERLRAYNARMVAQINQIADGCGPTETLLRRLAAGEVDDG